MTEEAFEKVEELRREIRDLQDVIDVLKDTNADEISRLSAVEVGYSDETVNAICSTARLSEYVRDKLIEVVQVELDKKEAEFANL